MNPNQIRKPGHLLAWIATAFLLLQTLLVSADPVPVGGISPNFTVTRWGNSQAVRLYDYAGKIVVLDFFAYWCGPCVVSSPDLEQNIQKYFDQRGGNQAGIPVVVLAVNIESQNLPATQSFITTSGLKNVANDFNGAAWNLYNTQDSIPLFVILNGVAGSQSHDQWEVVHAGAGYPGAEFMRARINSIAAPNTPRAPAIAVQPTPTEGVVGTGAELRIAATGSGTLSYQWYKDGNALPTARSEALSFASLRIEDAGLYRVRVSNGVGSVQSDEVRLSVYAAEYASIPDPTLNQAIRSRLSIPSGPILIAKLAQLKALDVTNGVVSTLSGLSHATMLESLHVREAALDNLADLRPLTALRALTINQPAPFPTLDPLENLPLLESLSLPQTGVPGSLNLTNPERLTTLQLGMLDGTGVSWLTQYANLTNLNLGGIRTPDIAPIGTLSRLKTLVLARTQAADWRWLKSLESLAVLDLGNCNLDSTAQLPTTAPLTSLALRDIKGLDLQRISYPTLRNLRLVRLGLESLPDSNWFSTLPALNFLDLTGNQLTHLDSVRTAGLLTRIRYLYAPFNRITRIDALQGWTRGWGVDLRGNYLDFSPGTPESHVADSIRPTAVFVWTEGQTFPVSVRPLLGSNGRLQLQVTGRANRRVNIRSGPSISLGSSAQLITLASGTEIIQPLSQPRSTDTTWFYQVEALE